MLDLRAHKPPKPNDFNHRVKDAQANIQNLIDDGNTPGEHDYQPLWTNYKPTITQAHFNGKCAYCESWVRASYPGEIDHYRPKTEVVSYKNRGARHEDTPPKRKVATRTKPGYWWLAYCWDNWLLSCKLCNGWKGSQFPTQPEAPCLAPGDEARYHPVLLNPMTDDPAPHFHFDESGMIQGETTRGNTTIDICGLDRKYLTQARQRVAQTIVKLADDLAVATNERNPLAYRQTVQRIIQECQPEKAYSGMVRYLVADLTGRSYQFWQEAIRQQQPAKQASPGSGF